jgi:hypothetical protein
VLCSLLVEIAVCWWWFVVRVMFMELQLFYYSPIMNEEQDSSFKEEKLLTQ